VEDTAVRMPWFTSAVHRRLSGLMVAVLATTALIAPALPAPVAAASAITALYSDGDGIIAGGVPTYITDAGITWTVTRSSDGNEVDVQTADPSSIDNVWIIRLAAKSGDVLAVGTYTAATYPSDPGLPKIDVWRSAAGCGSVSGQFTVEDITVDGGGNVTSFAASVEHHCNFMAASPSFLEIRYASTVPLRAITPTPIAVTFVPQVTGRDSPHRTVDVASVGNATTTVASVSITGPDAADFAVSSETCVGAQAPGQTCHVMIVFTPSAIGARQAMLVVSDDSFAGSHSVALTGRGIAYSVAPLTLDLGSHLVGSTGSATITLTNGNAAQPIDSYSFEWFNMDQPNPFSVRPGSGCTASASVPALAVCDVTIDFTPTTIGGVGATMRWTVGGQAATSDVAITGVGLSTTAVAWGSPHFVRGGAWTFGNGLARTTNGTAAYLHAVYGSDLIGSHYATDSGPYVGIFYRRSTNGGTTWLTPVRVSPATKHAARGVVAAYTSRVYVAYVTQTKWVRYSRTAPRILYVRKNETYGSGTWKTAVRLSSLTGRVDYPSIAVAGSVVYVAYTDAATGSVKVAISRDRATSWATRSLGTTTNALSDGKAGLPSVSAYGSLVVVAWTADSNGKVVVKVSKDAGVTWTGGTLATTGSDSATTAATSGRLSVAWPSSDGLRIRTWKASAWGPTVTVAPPGTPGAYAWFATGAIALRGTGQTGAAWAACHADCATGSPKLDLVWSESTDGGATFPHRQVIVDGTAGGPVYPANWYPSIVWATATTRYVLHWAETIGEGVYTVQVRTGSGAP
jgi:hypothetical protein